MNPSETLADMARAASARVQARSQNLTRLSAGRASSRRNVGQGERMVSAAAGAILALSGLERRDAAGFAIAALGGALVYRGVTGHCHLYEALDMNTAGAEDQATRGIRVEECILIDLPREELYSQWRDFEKLPQIMTHLRSVESDGNGRSHWTAEAPRLVGGQVEWEAETTADEPNRRIAWRSLPGSVVDHAGAVEFEAAPGDRGTYVRVTLSYDPPAGQLGHWVATLFGSSPEQQIKDDLRNFKRMMEVGELPTTSGQPKGTCLGRGRREG